MKTEPQNAKLATCNLLCAEALAVWGAVELAGGDSILSRALVGAMMACMGGLMFALVRVSGTHPLRTVRRVAASVAVVCLVAMMADLYMFLLSRANGATERAAESVGVAQTAAADEAATQAELAAWQATLARELQSSEGPKARSAKAEVERLRDKLESIRQTAAAAVADHQHRAPLLVACERFGWPVDVALKVVLAVVVFVGTVPAYVMLMAGGCIPLHDAPRVTVANPVAAIMPAPVLPGNGWQPAPRWLDESRRNLQAACAPDAITIKTGRRKAIK